MKTLDEVINEMEGFWISGTLADGLHYLKEYRELKQHFACMDKAEICNDATQITNGYWCVTYDGLHCSVCNYKLDTTAIPNICPNCGVKMGYEYRWTT